MHGSISEVRWLMGGRTPGFKRVRSHVADQDWEIVAFTSNTFVLRINRENVEFDRTKGTIKSRFSLGPRRS